MPCIFESFSINVGLSKELNHLKETAKGVADKVNAPGETISDRLAAVGGQIDQAVIQGVHYGSALGMASITHRTRQDFSILPLGFPEGRPYEVEDIDDLLDLYDEHATALARDTNPETILSKLFPN